MSARDLRTTLGDGSAGHGLKIGVPERKCESEKCIDLAGQRRQKCAMILSTHAIVGGAIASLFPSHPVLVALAGFASHFAIDAIPHWDYPLRSISVGRKVDNRGLKINVLLVRDLSLIGADACFGLAIALLFAMAGTVWVIALGAVAGMLPDPMQFVHSLYPRGPLKSLQRFHGWMHSKRKLAWRIGVASQVALRPSSPAPQLPSNKDCLARFTPTGPPRPG